MDNSNNDYSPVYNKAGSIVGISAPLNTNTKRAVQAGIAKVVPDFNLPYILETCDTVQFSVEALEEMVSHANAKTMSLEYILEHLPFNEVVFSRNDGNTYYFYKSQHPEEFWDFVLGFAYQKSSMVMAGYCYDAEEQRVFASCFPDGALPVWICDATGKVGLPELPESKKALEIVNSKFNAIMTLLFCMSKIPKQYVKQSEIKKKVKTVERKGKLKKKLFKKIVQRIVTVDSNVRMAEVEQRECEYTAENWTVRGHFRRYKSGKTVWIKPQNRHRDKQLLSKRKTEKQSVYRIGEVLA